MSKWQSCSHADQVTVLELSLDSNHEMHSAEPSRHISPVKAGHTILPKQQLDLQLLKAPLPLFTTWLRTSSSNSAWMR
jgi:hypothetical protein